MTAAFVPAQVPQGWTNVRSKNFNLIGDAGEDEIRTAAKRLEEFRSAMGQLLPTLKLESPGVPTNVVIFRNAASYRPFKPKRADGSVDDHIVGYFQAGDDANYITLSPADARADGYGTIFHEYVHFLISENFDPDGVPPWLNEGLAEYFETLEVDGRSVLTGAAPAGHLALLRRSQLIPLATVFETGSSELHKHGDESRSLFYAESWAIVNNIIRTGGESGLDGMIKLLDGTRDAKKAARDALGGEEADLEKNLRDYLGRPIIPLRSANTFVGAAAAMSARPLAEAEILAYQGDLLQHTNREPEAASYLRKALELDPRLPFAHASLGVMLMHQQRYADARRHLEIAAADPNANAVVIFNYAYSLVRGAMDKNQEIAEFRPETAQQIERALRRSIALKPDFAESRRLLAFVEMISGGDLDEAAALAKSAADMKPPSDEPTLLLAQIYLRQEKYSDARSIAERLAMLTTEPRIGGDARAIIEAANAYFAANASAHGEQTIAMVGQLPPLILKRSAVTDAEIAQIELDRIVNNLNRLLLRPKRDERQIAAYIERVNCSDNSIDYKINAGGQRSVFTSSNFQDLNMQVLTEGERSFRIECGGGFGKQLTVLTFRPAAQFGGKPELVAITFVPEIFRLKTAAEMARARIVVVEDDTLRRHGASKGQ